MSKEKEHKNLVPELRFPEFNEDWEIKQLGSIAENLSNRRIPITSSKREKGEIPYYGATGVIDYVKDFIFNEELLLISEDGANLIDRNYPIAFSISGKTWVNNHAHVLKFKDRSTETLVQKFVNSRSIEDFLTGQAQPKLNRKNLDRIPIPLAKTPKEQQKIAATLTSLDHLIAAENEKLEALQAHKKGLLQQLFPAKGEKVPKLRFGEFSEEWEETKLVQVADYENGKAHEKEIAESGKYIVVNSKFISSDGEVIKLSDSRNCKTRVGDILMVLSDVPNGKAIAKCFYVDKDDTYTVNQRICRITSSDINSRFLYYVLNKNPYFLSFDDGVKQTNLRKDTVLNCPLLKPTDPKEQEKIAECIDSISSQILNQSENIETLKVHKKGLMQQMFPNIKD